MEEINQLLKDTEISEMVDEIDWIAWFLRVWDGSRD